jgi:hypothetical protein
MSKGEGLTGGNGKVSCSALAESDAESVGCWLGGGETERKGSNAGGENELKRSKSVSSWLGSGDSERKGSNGTWSCEDLAMIVVKK